MRRFLFVIWILLIAGGILWWIRYAPESPTLSFAQLRRPEIRFSPQEFVKNMDTQIAESLRNVRENGLQLPEVGSSQVVNDVKNATLSATVSTTPEELWKTLREEGAQSVVSSLAQSANVSVNDLSADIVSEARYQYCLGVVDQHQQSQENAPSF